MSNWAYLSSRQGLLVTGVATIGLAALLAYWFGAFTQAPPIAPPVQIAAVPAEQTAPPAKTAAPQPAITVTTPEPPKFDVVRIETDGQSLVAGQAAPNSTVTILLDGIAVSETQADASGKFVAFLTLPASEGARVLTLQTYDAASATNILSDDQVLVAPTAMPTTAAAPETTVATPVAEAPQPAETQTTSAATTGTTTAVAPEPVAQPTPATPAVILATKDDVQVLQPPIAADTPPEVLDNVALDAIRYSDAGEVELIGRALGQGFVRVYLDDSPVTTSRIAANGAWRTDLPDVDTGVYTLRIDQVDPAGKVTSRVETPFKREDQAVLAATPVPAQSASVAAVTVQPGTTLWAIAREKYGSGTEYLRVFEANRDRIRNPDLIYPGQVFTVPNE